VFRDLSLGVRVQSFRFSGSGLMFRVEGLGVRA